MGATTRHLALLAAAAVALAVFGPSSTEEAPVAGPSAAPADVSTPAESPVPARPTTDPQGRLDALRPASGGDGDSWRDLEGREYRLGLINTPETGECFGSEATRERQALTADGFSADVYAQDRYGRGVAVVRTADGTDLNVHLARYGFADDRYLAQYRDENPQLAARLDPAFAAARAEQRGLWAVCSGRERSPVPVDPAPTTGSGCHVDYTTCVPVQGDGSGVGRSNDLDCGSITGAVHVRRAGVDPYRLDADGDGIGCDS